MSEILIFNQGMFIQATKESETVPITVQLALLSEAYLEQRIFLADIIVLMHNHHNFQRGRLHVYSQNGLRKKKTPNQTQQ